MLMARMGNRPSWLVGILDFVTRIPFIRRLFIRWQCRKLRRALSRLGPILIEEYTPAQAGMSKAISLFNKAYAMRQGASLGAAAGREES